MMISCDNSLREKPFDHMPASNMELIILLAALPTKSLAVDKLGHQIVMAYPAIWVEKAFEHSFKDLD
jgi:hypothetical protein